MKSKTDIRLEELLSALSEKRPVFVSEADFQLELAWSIKEQYPDAVVRLEYRPLFDSSMHIDILVILDGKWIPIELKYKTKGCVKHLSGEVFNLREQSAKDIGCYLYLKDISRIERIRENVAEFSCGYTVFITNDMSYPKTAKDNVGYKAFALEESSQKSGVLDWGENTGIGTKGKDCASPIMLLDKYDILWKNYSVIDDTPTGVFKYLLHRIDGK